MVSNGLGNTVGLNLIYRPIIRFTISGRRITFFAPVRYVDSWSSQAVEFSAAITRCTRVHIQIVTVWASKMGDIFSLPATHTLRAFSFMVLYIFVKIPVFPGCHSDFLKSHFVFPKSHLAFQRVKLFRYLKWLFMTANNYILWLLPCEFSFSEMVFRWTSSCKLDISQFYDCKQQYLIDELWLI